MYIIIFLIVTVAIIFIIRLFGAWMLRIDDVIALQKQMLNELKKISTKPE